MKTLPFPIHTYIIFIIGILVYIFTLNLISGNLFHLYSDKGFDIDSYYEFWKKMTSEQRLFLSETYYKFYIILKQKIDGMKSTNNLDIKVKYLNSSYYYANLQFENVPYILVSVIPKNKTNFDKKLLICAHFDGHNLTSGGTAYDDAINVVTMVGTIEYLLKKDIKLNTQVDFLFDGAEEFGLVGAYQYADYLKDNNIIENYDYLNLEAMGGAPPYAFVIKNGKGNYRIQKALSYTTGSILLAMNYLYDTGFVSSSTDHVVFNDQGWLGGVNVFLGKGSVYHTKYDKIYDDESKEHLKMAGNQLIDFVLNYEYDGYDGNSIGYGIAPICVVLPILVLYILVPFIFIGSVVVIIIKERNNIKEFFFDLLMQFICFIIVLAIFLVLGLVLSFINSNSASASQAFVILTAIMGLFLFLIFHRILNIKKWSRFKIVLNSLLMMVSITTDLSIPFVALNILSAIFYFFDNKIIKYISAFFQYLVMSLFYALMIKVFTQFTTRLYDIMGNLFVFLIFFLFSYHISISPLDLYEIPQEEKLLSLIKGICTKKKAENDSLNDDEELHYNISDELVDETQSKSTLKSLLRNKDKICNKKLIPVYLFFCYILYFIILLLILFLKPSPFSEDFVLRGTFLNIYEDSQNSTMIFSPQTIGYNFAKKELEKSEFKNKFKEELCSNYLYSEYDDDKCIAVKSDEFLDKNNSQCNFTMPNIDEIMNLDYNGKKDNDKYNFTFSFHISNKHCIEMIYIYIHCDDCVYEVNGKAYDDKIKKYLTKRKLLIKVGKKEIDDSSLADIYTQSHFLLNTNNFNYSVYLNTMKNSQDYLKFLDSFGEATSNSKSTLVADTIFKYEGSCSS